MVKNSDAIRPEEEALRKALEELVAFDPEALARTDVLGTKFDFSRAVPLFRRTLSLFLQLRDLNLEMLPNAELTRLTSFANQLKSQLTQINDFDPATGNNPTNARDGLINQLQNRYNEWFKEIAPIIAYLSRGEEVTAEIANLARKELEQVKLLRSALEKESEEARRTARETLEHVQRAAAELGVSQHAGRFKEEAEKHKILRGRWLIATVVSAGVLLAYGGVNVWYYLTHRLDIPPSQTVQLALSKLVVFGALSFAVMWTSRMYRAESHNFVVNQHRQNALATFETFVKAARDDQTRDAVLLQATRSIFSHQSTGFSTSEQDNPGSTQVLEIIRGLMPGHGQQ